LVDPGLGFRDRHRRPPTDPVNAALSLGYSFLAVEADGAIAAAGLDPRVGLLHGDSRGQPALALDLMEEFRPLIVDTMVLEAFRRRSLAAGHFTIDPKRGCRLTAQGWERFVAAYEERLLTPFLHLPTAQR
jgi:CRISPR-associated protein Cas1